MNFLVVYICDYRFKTYNLITVQIDNWFLLRAQKPYSHYNSEQKSWEYEGKLLESV